MNVFGLQWDIAWENKPANFAKVRELLNAARPGRGSIVALPEMFATGFSMNVDGISETYNGDTERFLSQTASEFGIWLIAGAAVRCNDGKARNKALIFSPSGKLHGFYAKMKPFTVGGEGKHYAAGAKVSVLEVENVRLAPFVCFDLRFPELFRRAAAMSRPELFVVIASWPEKRAQHWTPMIQSRAIENQAYVLAVNRVGADPYYTYCGDTMLVDPHGKIVAHAGAKEGFVQAALDLEMLRKYREGLPFLDDLVL